MNVIQKNQSTSFLLTIFFGPLGLLYASIGRGLFWTLIAVVFSWTIVVPIACWPIAIIEGYLSVNRHNKNVDKTIALLGGKNQ